MSGTATLATLREELRQVLGGPVSTDPADRVAYARDMWPRQQIVVRQGRAAPAPPAVVVWPRSTEEVAAVVRFAARRGLPVVPFGAGSGVCGGVLPAPEAIVLDLKRMARLRRVDPAAMHIEVEAGILGQHLEERLAEQGLTLGHFPSSILCSTVGGWIAGRSAGQCSGRYGKIEDMLLGLTFVDGEGRVHRVERDGEGGALLPLLTGSEGVLGVVTAARFRVAMAPAERRFAAYRFPTVAAGLRAIRAIYQAGLRPAVARLYDPLDSFVARMRGERPSGGGRRGRRSGPRLGPRLLVASLRRHGLLGRVQSLEHAIEPLLGGALLVLLWEDDPELGRAERLEAHRLALAAGGRDEGEGPARRWLKKRYAVSYRQAPLLAAGAFVDTMEVAAPWSSLPGLHEAVREALGSEAFVVAHFSHAYPDGASIYFTFAGAARDDDEALERYDRAWRRALQAAVRAGGVLSHHHGVGRSKAPALRREQGAAVDVVAALKATLDPAGVLNPGVLLPPEPAAAAGEAAPGPAEASPEAEEAPEEALLPATEAELREAVAAAQRAGRPLFLGEGPAPEGARLLSLRRLDEVIALDEASELVHVQAGRTVEALERFLRVRGRTLGLSAPPPAEPLAHWIARGAPGLPGPDDDPVAPRIAGLEAVLPDGRWLRIRPAPRRATGPDLLALFLGAGHRFGVVATVHLPCPRRRPTRHLAWRFPSPQRAAEALARMRALGVRPRGAWAGLPGEPSLLLLALSGEGSRPAQAAERIVERVARGLGAQPASPPEPLRLPAPARPELPEPLRRLAERLDPAGILSRAT